MPIEIGKMLVQAGKITDDQLNKALEMQKSGSGKLGEILVKIGAIEDENVVSEFVGKQLNIGALRLTDVELNPEDSKINSPGYCPQVQCHCSLQGREDFNCRHF